jgi:penicillin-binding protein 2
VADWKSRDHSLFICYAPTDAPRYAMSVVVEHGGFGASAAAPIAKDVMTYLFDPGKAWDTLLALEKDWGGTAQERLDARYRQYVAQYGVGAPKVSAEEEIEKARQAEPDEAQPDDGSAQSPPDSAGPRNAADVSQGGNAGASPASSNGQAATTTSGGAR